MRNACAAERNNPPLPFSNALPCGQASKAVFPKGFAAMVCAARAIAASQRRSCRRQPSRRPSTWFASVRCCNGLLLDSRPGPSALGLLLLVCNRAWRHDVRTKFPSRVIHTPALLLCSTGRMNMPFPSTYSLMSQSHAELVMSSISKDTQESHFLTDNLVHDHI